MKKYLFILIAMVLNLAGTSMAVDNVGTGGGGKGGPGGAASSSVAGAGGVGAAADQQPVMPGQALPGLVVSAPKPGDAEKFRLVDARQKQVYSLA